jgi:Glycosyltransferase family 87
MSEVNHTEFSEAVAPAILARRRSIFFFVLTAFFVQLQFLLMTALCRQEGPLFAERHPFGMDFYDFPVAAGDWLSGRNPYLNVRFNKPPVTLLLGLALRPLGFPLSTYVFFAANLAVVITAVWCIGRRLGLERVERWLLLAITSLYYPFLFLMERGNLDGLMLGLTAIFLCSRSRGLRTLALALSINLKAYTALLLAPLALRRWREAAAVMVAAILMALPFAHLVLTSIQMIGVREVLQATVENLSPGALLAFPAKHHPALRTAYSLSWLASYGAMLYRRRGQSFTTLAIVSLAWMVALPMTVLAYSGVMLLPVFALRVREMAFASKLSWADKLFLAGFLLTGVEQYSLYEYYGAAIHSHNFFGSLNYLGTTLLLISLVLSKGATGTAGDAAPGPLLRMASVEHSA